MLKTKVLYSWYAYLWSMGVYGDLIASKQSKKIKANDFEINSMDLLTIRKIINSEKALTVLETNTLVLTEKFI